jgi:hypothetical protein
MASSAGGRELRFGMKHTESNPQVKSLPRLLALLPVCRLTGLPFCSMKRSGSARPAGSRRAMLIAHGTDQRKDPIERCE